MEGVRESMSGAKRASWLAALALALVALPATAWAGGGWHGHGGHDHHGHGGTNVVIGIGPYGYGFGDGGLYRGGGVLGLGGAPGVWGRGRRGVGRAALPPGSCLRLPLSGVSGAGVRAAAAGGAGTAGLCRAPSGPGRRAPGGRLVVLLREPRRLLPGCRE